MQLRTHPRMAFLGHHNWPPVWVGLRDVGANHRKLLWGEIGTLTTAHLDPKRRDRIFLCIEHEGADYIGCLLFDPEDDFCRDIAAHLQRCCGLTIGMIGSSEIVASELHS